MLEQVQMKINVFTIGDSRIVRTWSGLPYFFCKALEAAGVKVVRTNIEPDGTRARLFASLYRARTSARRWLLGWRNDVGFLRTPMYATLVAERIKTACAACPNADGNFFLTFSFSSCGLSQIPVVHYCDQTYEQLLRESGSKALTYAAKWHIQNEIDNLRHAALIFGGFPSTIRHLRDELGLGNVYPKYMSGINQDSNQIDVTDLVAHKEESSDFLFIGKSAYARGADILVKAFRILDASARGRFRLNIVGLSRKDLGLRSDESDMVCYKYLDRGDAEQNKTYQNLLENARVFVMPQRTDMVAIAMQEALLLCTPVVVSDLENIRAFVKDGENGLLLADVTPQACAAAMRRLVDDRDIWRRMAHNAHASARDRTWESIVKEMLQVIEKRLVTKSGHGCRRDP
jgi:glycosyltransferase involved in cell wall biosynthesis